MKLANSKSADSNQSASHSAPPASRYVVLALGLMVCAWGIWSSGREGLSTLITSYASTTNQLETVDRASRLSPSSSEAHYLRARLFSEKEQRVEAVKALEQAAALRPQDYVLWLELGRARDDAGDVAGALVAFRESARLAPFYAQPRWQLGNALLRSGSRDEALAELRRAAASNPSLFPSAINLAWLVLDRDPRSVVQALQPQTPSAHLALATFLAAHGQPAEAVAHFRAAGKLSNDQRRALLNELLKAKNFAEAHLVWSLGRPANGAKLVNAGFEEPIALDEPGFGWQVGANPQTVRTSLDPAAPSAGSYSLRLDWSGDSDPQTPIVSQLVLVEPGGRYRLKFAARTQEMLTIGLPVVMVVDANSEAQSVLMQSEGFPRGTSGWQNLAIEFATTDSTRAVQIVIRRQKCETFPCGAIGQAWVDDFSLEKL